MVWAGTRVVSTVAFLWAASIQGPSYWYPWAKPNYFDFLNIWDVEWYHRIFDFGLGQAPGYQLHLPLNTTGGVEQNAWAFMPGFPMLVRALTWLTGVLIPWKFLAPTASLVLSFALALAIFKAFSLKFESATSLWGVAIFGLWCAAPILQTGYAETLGLLFLAGGLYFLMQHRYLASVPFLMGLSLTRPGMVAFGLSLAGMWVVRAVKHSRAANAGELGFEFTSAERWKLFFLTAASGLLGLLWPIIAWLATGRIDAYTATELAWRNASPDAHLVIMSGWFDLVAQTVGPVLSPWLTPVVLAIGIALTIRLMVSESVRQLGNELRLWVGAYLFYLLLFFNPQSSTFRILMPAFPLAAALAVKSKSWPVWLKVSMALILILSQFVWLAVCWVYAEPDFTPP